MADEARWQYSFNAVARQNPPYLCYNGQGHNWQNVFVVQKIDCYNNKYNAPTLLPIWDIRK